MASLTVIWWRDIPAQVIAKDRRQTHKLVLHPRFQVAIDRAAMKAGMKQFDDYIEQWRRESGPAATTSRPRRRPRPSASRPRTRSARLARA